MKERKKEIMKERMKKLKNEQIKEIKRETEHIVAKAKAKFTIFTRKFVRSNS